MMEEVDNWAMRKDNIKPNSILQEADIIVNGERAKDYGPATSFKKIAKVASLLTNKDITSKDVIKILLAVKLIRESFKHKRDNLVDLCGYAELLNQIVEGDTHGEC
jgi:hypothetical protein